MYNNEKISMNIEGNNPEDPSQQQHHNTTTSNNSTQNNNDIKLAGEESKERMYESKHHKKVVRVLTVLAYVLSVSLAAIMLSLYYVFIWDPRSTRNITKFTAAQQISSKISPTRCPPDLNAIPPGINIGPHNQPFYPVTTPSIGSEGSDKMDEFGDDGEVEPPRALPRAPSHHTNKKQPSKDEILPSETPPIAA